MANVGRLRDASHASSLTAELDRLRRRKRSCDVVVVVGLERFPAHKAVLCCTSDFFTGCFSGEAEIEEILLQGSAESFRAILDFAYTGWLALSSSTAVAILRRAVDLYMPSAVALCAEYLMGVDKASLSLADAFDAWTIAGGNGLDDLAAAYRAFLATRFVECVRSQSFLQRCSAASVAEILDDEEVEAVDEEQILRAAKAWMRYDWKERKGRSVDILRKIRLGRVPLGKLVAILGEELMATVECREMVASVVDALRAPGSHPGWFASRNTITANIYLKRRVPAKRVLSLRCATEERCYRLVYLADIPEAFTYPYTKADKARNWWNILVSDAGDLYAAGGKDIAIGRTLKNCQRRLENFAWLNEYNFFRYDADGNEWTPLPPMLRVRFVPLLFQFRGHIYAVGLPAPQAELDSAVERYSLAEQRWELISHGIGFGATNVACTDDLVLIKGIVHEEDVETSRRVRVVKLAAYLPDENKTVNVVLRDARRFDLEEGSYFTAHRNALFLTNKSHPPRRIDYGIEGDHLTLSLIGPADDPQLIEPIADVIPPSVQRFTFDKRRLGMRPIFCECHRPRSGSRKRKATTAI